MKYGICPEHPSEKRCKHSHRSSVTKFLAVPVALIALATGSELPIDPDQSRLLSQPHTATSSPPIDRSRIIESYARFPMSFEANRGQTDLSTDFVARGSGYTIYLASGEAKVALPKATAGVSELRLKLAGPAHVSEPVAMDPLPGRSNYFIGNDPGQWRTDIPNFSRVRYHNVYQGIDLVYYGNGRQLEYDFIVAPLERPEQIDLQIEGADDIAVEPQGDLVIKVDSHHLQMRKPIVYQEIKGKRQLVAANYRIKDGNHVGFEIGDYDQNLPLVIDPIVEYATFFGGGGTDVGYGIAVDAKNNVYVTGQTSSLNFPLKNAVGTGLEGANDAFVMKLNAQGNGVVFSTYIGGRNPGDRGWAIAVDKGSNVYFTGETNSLNFPTVNAAQPVFRGGSDGFVAKLSVEGNVLLYSTYLGGGFTDASYSIALDRFDNAYITGRTESTNFPVKNPLQDKLRGQRDAFVTIMSPDGEIRYSTYLGGEPVPAGGRDEEAGYGIALDSLLNIYLVGATTSSNFPTANAIQPTFGGVDDAFVTKLSPLGSSLIYSTYLGGTRTDVGRGIAVDALGNAYVTGYTLSLDFPRAAAIQPTYGGSVDGYVAKINASGTKLLYSTYLGGSSEENTGLITDVTPSCAIAVDSLGCAYVTGKTASQNFPVVRAINETLRGDNDAFLTKLDPAGSELIYSTFLGSTFTGANGFDERGLSVVATSLGTVFVTGQVLKSDYQTILPVQTSFGGGLSDVFITKISSPDIPGIAALSAASFVGGSLAAESIVTAFGSNLASGTEVATVTPLPTTLLGTTVRVKDKQGIERAAPLFFVSPTQVNFQIPLGVVEGKATITITNAQNNSTGSTVLIENVAPGVFSASANGQGFAAAVALRVKQDGTQIFEPVVQFDEFGQLVALPIDLGPETEQVFLLLFGTGWRNNDQLSNVVVRIGGAEPQVTYAGAQGTFVGQDQINLLIPRSLAGRGSVLLTVTVDGRIANQVSVSIR